MRLQLCGLRQSYAGIALAFGRSGAGNLKDDEPADLKWRRMSGDLIRESHSGALLAFMESF
jgi:hypothetical protein